MNNHFDMQEDPNSTGKGKYSTQDLEWLKSMSRHKRPSICTQSTDGSEKEMVKLEFTTQLNGKP